MTLKTRVRTPVIRLVLAAMLIAAGTQKVAGDEPDLKRPTLQHSDPNHVIAWTRNVYSNGKWNVESNRFALR